jgi:hypothetical protein
MMNTPTWLCSTSVRYLFSELISACCICRRSCTSSAEPVKCAGALFSSRVRRTLLLTQRMPPLASCTRVSWWRRRRRAWPLDQRLALGRIGVDVEHAGEVALQLLRVAEAEHAGQRRVHLHDLAVQAAAEQAHRRIVEQLAVAALGLLQRAAAGALLGDVAQRAGGGDVALVVDRVGAHLAQDAHAVLAHHHHSYICRSREPASRSRLRSSCAARRRRRSAHVRHADQLVQR